MTIPSVALDLEARFTQGLRADSNPSGGRRQVRAAHYSRVLPARFSAPRLVAYAPEVEQLLRLPPGFCSGGEAASYLSGQTLLPNSDPFAMCYGGHQFGHWAGQLGDGRAINLGERRDRLGELQALQLKGSGPTPYSRSADGFAVLRSSVREFLCSEAMYALDVPTTRALSLVLTGDQVLRDMFYDGHARHEPGAIVCRVAPSFVRFGNFEIFAARGELEPLRELANFVIREHFGHLVPASGILGRDEYLAWFREVGSRTAELLVHWARIGFVHGVMNTDNMSILGLTIDYGPYGWLEGYDPEWTPNTTDAGGRRYAFGNQGPIGLWNLVKLANALLPLIDDVPALQALLAEVSERYDRGWEAMMAAKLGLREWQQATDPALMNELLAVLASAETDWTIFFRSLAQLDAAAPNGNFERDLEILRPALYQPEPTTEVYRRQLSSWLAAYRRRLLSDGREAADRRGAMLCVNPKFVLRNYLAQNAIDAAEKGDYAPLQLLQHILRSPYDEQPEYEAFAARRPDWARHRAGCSMLSCSS